jgi:hypothetical protein
LLLWRSNEHHSASHKRREFVCEFIGAKGVVRYAYETQSFSVSLAQSLREMPFPTRKISRDFTKNSQIARSDEWGDGTAKSRR